MTGCAVILDLRWIDIAHPRFWILDCFPISSSLAAPETAKAHANHPKSTATKLLETAPPSCATKKTYGSGSDVRPTGGMS